ncbi:hypothetical protein GDO78_021068, partial [Eleutherodactylus coqui]
YSKRMCVHTGVQEGTEKKQAASGTSTSRGTRKKSVQSSTRRRSTRNSKSEASNLQSSPKSSSSDHEAPGYNTTTTTNTSSSGPPSKQPAKPRKQAPKKGTQTRKRLRSATQSQKGSKDKDNSESEPEQEKKCKRSEDDLSETELYKMNQSPNNINEKEGHHAQMSSPEQSEEKLDSSPAHNVLSVDEERSASPDVNNDHPLPLEQSSPSPVFKNGENDLEDKVDLPSGMDSAENSLEIEEKHSWEPENLNVSHGESSLSPDSVKHITSDHTDMPLLSCDKVEESVSSPPSHTQIKSPTKHLADVLSSESVDDDEENTLHTSQGNLQANESHFENMESSSIQSPLPPELEKECDLDDIPPFSDASEEPSIQKLEKVQLEPNSLKTANSQVEQKSILEVNLQAENQEKHIEAQDTKTSISSESDHQHTSDDLVNSVEFLQQSLAPSKDSAAEELSDTGEIQGSRLCSKLESPKLEEGNIHDMDGKIDLQNDHQKVFCEDNIEPVAMECDSVCSDHNDLEVEQPVNVTEPVKTESDDLASNKVPPSPPKQSLPLGDAQKKESRTRRSRFHSPSTTWSPSKNEVKERPRSRSRSKVRDSPVKCKSRSHSREKDGERSHSGQWKGRSRDRHHRRHSRSRSRQSRSRSKHSRSRSRHSKSKSRSRSRSGSHTRYKNKSVTIDRNERDCSSPPWKERHSNENWKSPRGSEKYRRNELDRHDHFRNEKYDARDSAEAYPDNKNDYPDWVIEKMKSADSRGRGDTWMRGESRGRGDRGWNDGRGDRGRGGNRGRGSHWEDSQYGSGDSWNRNVNVDWNSPRSRGGRGRGGFRGAFNYGDQNENWNSRQPYSGNSNTSGQESSRFPESKMKLKYEDSFDSPADRSGWSSASSWAVRKTLPADVQNYYSKRGRNSTGAQGGVWPKQEESQEQVFYVIDIVLPFKQGHPGASYVSNNVSAPLLPAPAPVQGTVGVVLGPNSVSVATTGHSKNSHTPIKPAPRKESVTVEASADSSKKEKKILIQERAAQEVKGAIKPYYQNKDITKDEYKEIVKKAVDKVR